MHHITYWHVLAGIHKALSICQRIIAVRLGIDAGEVDLELP